MIVTIPEHQQQAEVLPPIPGSASTGEIIKSKPVLGELNHRKKHLQRVEQTGKSELNGVVSFIPTISCFELKTGQKGFIGLSWP